MHSRSWAVVAMLVLLVNSASASAQSEDQLEALKQEAVIEVESLRKFTQQAVDQLFSFGELGFQEFETSSYVTGILRDNGFEVEQDTSHIARCFKFLKAQLTETKKLVDRLLRKLP
jgi:aminobenzoyl-glutamate utilization protein B